MTGIERLRELGREQEERSWSTVGKVRGRLMLDIADQIAREHAEDCFKMGERAAEDAEAVAWVREHGGIEVLRRMFQDADSRRVELCAALGIDLDKGWSEAMAAMRRRLMPEDMEWPRFEDGKPVRIGDEFAERIYGNPCKVGHFAINKHAFLIFDEEDVNDCEAIDHGTHKRAKRPAPKVLDADRVEIRVGDTVWHVETGEQCKVVEVDSRSVSVDFRVDGGGTKHTGSVLPSNLTHRAPVLAADGRPLREGETVWHEDGTELRVLDFLHEEDGETIVKVSRVSGPTNWSECRSLSLTHECPDTWERLEEDCAKSDIDYCAERGLLDPSCDAVEGDESSRHCTDCGCTCGEKMARDLVRRARALAGDA